MATSAVQQFSAPAAFDQLMSKMDHVPDIFMNNSPVAKRPRCATASPSGNPPPAKKVKTVYESNSTTQQYSSTPTIDTALMIKMQQKEAIELLRKKRKDKQERCMKDQTSSTTSSTFSKSRNHFTLDGPTCSTGGDQSRQRTFTMPCEASTVWLNKTIDTCKAGASLEPSRLPDFHRQRKPVVEHASRQEHLAATPPSLLHRACRHNAQSAHVIKSILLSDPSAAGKRALLMSPNPPKVNINMHQHGKSNANAFTCNSTPKQQRPHRQGSYPLHIALRNDATTSVVQMLVGAAPEVLLEADDVLDGGVTPLGIALAFYAHPTIVNFLLCCNPQSASIPDHRLNLPLHAAVVSDVYSLDVVSAIAFACPGAIHEKNFDGNTPLEVAQKSAKCDDDVIDYLQKLAFEGLESQLEHL